MITGWGAHHLDSAHWAMGTEHTGPVEISGTAEFPKKGLWDVHGPFRTEGVYADGVRMIVSGEFPNGIRFEGTEGWIFVSRGNESVTSSDPVAKLKDAQALSASDPRILTSVIGPDEVHLYESKDHHGNWLDCVRSRQAADRPRGGRPPLLLRLPAPPHRDEDESQAPLGPAAGALQERRRGERPAVAAAALAVWLLSRGPSPGRTRSGGSTGSALSARSSAELEGLGVVALDAGQQERLRLFHEQAIASLAARFDVDASEAEKRLSLGMRVASLLGAMALAAAVYFFFYRFWGGLPTAAQVGLLALAPVLAVAGMEVAARRERTLYVTGILGLVAVAAFVIDLDVLGAVFNLRPSPGAFLAWSAFAGLLAYAYGLRLLLLAAVAGFTVFFSAQVASAMHCPWDAFGERPENLFLPAALLLAAAALPSPGRPRFPPLLRASGLFVLFVALFVVSSWGWASYLPWPAGTVEVVYQLASFGLAGLSIAVGARRGWREVEIAGTVFLVLLLFARFFDWWWDFLPRWLFFLVIGALSVGLLLALRRLRSTRHPVPA